MSKHARQHEQDTAVDSLIDDTWACLTKNLLGPAVSLPAGGLLWPGQPQRLGLLGAAGVYLLPFVSGCPE